ncbi:exopolysaccharide biosynthesis protein VpsH [soil metagenome]
MSMERLYQKSPIWLQELGLNAYGLWIGAHRYGGAVNRELGRIRDQELWPRAQMIAHQDARIRALVSFAFERSSYYRDLLRELRIHPADIRQASDLGQLPLLEKETIRTEGARMLSRGKPGLGWVHGHTSGTTGSPLGLWYDRQTCIATNAVDLQQKLWGGRSNDAWIGMFLGRVVVPIEQEDPPFWRRNLAQRQIWFSSLHLEDRLLASYVDYIRRSGVKFLEGYPSTLFILAQHLARRDETLAMVSVFTSSETLHPTQKALIEERLECPIFDFYGHAERTMFGIECEHHTGKHIAEDFGYVEVINAAGEPVPDGAWGYLVGTSLHNRAMPMIRYRTSDVSRILVEPCACGRTSRRMAQVETKAEDLIVTPSGRMISPSSLTHPFKSFPTLEKSQVIQARRDLILVRLVASGGFSEENLESLRRGIAERVGPGITIKVEMVDDIPREASGKFRWVISKVAHDGQLDWTPDQTSNGA